MMRKEGAEAAPAPGGNQATDSAGLLPIEVDLLHKEN
jgi:hypothetical protein